MSVVLRWLKKASIVATENWKTFIAILSFDNIYIFVLKNLTIHVTTNQYYTYSSDCDDPIRYTTQNESSHSETYV